MDEVSERSSENEASEGEEGEGFSVKNDGETVPFSSNKRVKKISIDRLSELPDALLIHILSYLGTKKAAATSPLSKRWRSLWTELPKLWFYESSTDIEKTRKLVARVNRTLVLRTGNYLEDFEISFAYEKGFARDVDVWVEFAVRNKVKDFCLKLHSCMDAFYMLPEVMYSCSSLTGASFQGCILWPLGRVDWRNLTNLSIEDVELPEDVIRKVLSGCPVLSSLHLTACWGFERLEIESQCLHYLTIEDCEDEEYTSDSLEISAPYLRYLSISPFLIGKKKVRITNIPSLVTADIHFDIPLWGISVEEMIDTMVFFEDIKHVKELTLGCQCIEVLSKLAENGWQLPESTREHLTVEAWRNENSISGIFVLLESSPKLETLVIQCFGPYKHTGSTWGQVARGDLSCDLLHLKTVSLTNFADPLVGGEPLLTMAQILLKRATALEKIVVDHRFLAEFPLLLIEVSVALLSYPRVSEKAVVVLKH